MIRLIFYKEVIDTAELKLVSPLLDGMSVLECLNNANGFACYLLKQDATGEKFVLKHISVPESDTNVEALILTGAVADREEAKAYYRRVAEAQAIEVRNWQRLAGHNNLSVFTGFQLEVREEDRIGYDFYLLAPYRTSLHAYMRDNAITHLQALNLGIDLCNALTSLRNAGYIHQDLKPENIFVDDNGQFAIGDLGLAPLEDLAFAALPEHYSNCYCAPELADIMANLNPTVDLYSVGMILYHLFNGKHAPFEEEGKTMAEADQMRLAGEPLPGPLYADYELTAILLKACAFRPEDRYQTPQELRQDLVVYMQKNEISDAMIVCPIDLGENIEITEENMDADAALTGEENPEEMTPADAAEPAPEPEAPAEEFADAPETEDTAASEPSAPEDAPVEEPAPVEDAAAAEEPLPEEEPAATEEPLPVEEPAATEEPLPEEEPAATEEPLPVEDAASPEEPLPEAEPETTEVTAQSSLDDILADVNSYIAPEAKEEPEAAPAAPADEDDPEAIMPRRKTPAPDSEQPPKKKKRIWIPIVITILVLALLGAAGWFSYSHWFHVVMSDLTAETGGDYVAVSYTLNIPDAPLTADCKDTYGNSFEGEFNGSTVVFRNLTPGTQYYITFDVPSPRMLTGTTSINVTTVDAVEVQTFTAARGMNSRTVNLTLVTAGPAPEEWTLHYGTETGQTAVTTFTGTTATISDLALNELYTFTLQAPEGRDLVGQTSVTYEVIPEVAIEGLHISAMEEDAATVSWNSVGDETNAWHLTCTGTDYIQEVDVSECSATFTGIDPTAAYTFTLTARGMESAASITLDADSTIVSAFTAEAAEDGTIAVAWECSSEAQPESWLVEYTVANNPDLTTTIKTAQPETTIVQAIPGTEYLIQLLADDGRSLVGGTVVTLATPEAESFTDYDFSEEAVSLRFFPAPAASDPTYADLADAEPVTEFSSGDKICLALQAPEGFEADSSDEDADWLITIVLRDADGIIVDSFPLSSTWSDMWTDSNYVVLLPRTPSTAGSYQVALYFNNQYVAQSSFTILPEEA